MRPAFAKYRAARDPGANPSTGLLDGSLRSRVRAPKRNSKSRIKRLVLQLRDITAVLTDADPKVKGEVYAELGVDITH